MIAFVLTVITIVIIWIIISVIGPFIAFAIGAGGLNNFIKSCLGLILLLIIICLIFYGINEGWTWILNKTFKNAG